LAKVTPTLPEFASRHGLLFLGERDVDFIREYRQTWKLKAATAGKQLDRFKSFFTFCVSQKWIGENPAEPLRPPIGSDDDVPVIPFTKERFARIINACGDNEFLKTFILVMRYSGLATVDAGKLTPDRLEGDHLRLRIG
jgi:site-specific recombinase XerD